MVGVGVGVGVQGADTGTVGATVTPTLVAVSIPDGVVDYGVLNYSDTEDTVTLGDPQSILNDGNVNEDFAVRTSDAIGSGSGTTDWAHVAAASIDKDKYCHQYSIDNGVSWPDFPVPAGGTYTADIITDITPGNAGTLDLQILMPTDSTDVDDTKTSTVTVLATAS